MRVIDLSGSQYERGQQQGEALRADFAALLATFFASDLWKQGRPLPLPAGAMRWAMRFLGASRTEPLARRHLPMQHARVAGLGRGLGVDACLAWGIHFMEILFCEAGKSLAVPTAGCTQLHAVGPATRDGRPLLARNYDFPNLLGPFQVVRRELPSEPGRLATTSVTQVALAGTHMGVNEAGLAVAANNARLWRGPDFDPRGMPYLLILQEILESCRRVGEAADLLRRFPARGNAGFLGLVDETGEAALVEFTASRTALRRPDAHGVLAQTNHFHALQDANLPRDACWTVAGMRGVPYAASTEARFAAADRRLHERAGAIDRAALEDILRDHGGEATGNDCTVCCHGASGSTLSSFVVEPATRTLWVADGTPCASAYEKVEMRGR